MEHRTATPTLALTDFGGKGRFGLPLLVLGPSLGTVARTLWGAFAQRLVGRFHVVAWDLPGHGYSPPATGFTVAALAQAVLTAASTVLAERDEPGGTFHYAGDSIGGAVGIQILIDRPGQIASATLLCTGARIGEPAAWHERAAAVRANGTEPLLKVLPDRWFGPGFAQAEAARANALLDDVRRIDPDCYAAVCEALAEWDLRDRLHEISAPVLAVAGQCDVVTPVSGLRHIADGVQHGRLVVLKDVGHLAPAEQPGEVAALVAANAVLSTVPAIPTTTARVRAAGMRIRREVLGDAYADRASASATGFMADFQQLITQFAWGTVWARPGLDRRSRSLIALTALVARGHQEELAMHLRAALNNGLTSDEIKELLLQTAIYCGVPEANTAFRIAQQVLADPDGSVNG